MLVAGIDIATAEVRVVCVDPHGVVVAEAAAPLPPVRREDGRAEQDARAWWPAVAGALRRVTGRLGEERTRIVAVAPATTSGTLVLSDAGGEPVGAALMYDDARATAEAAEADELGRGRWAAYGLRIGPSFALAKLAWLARQPRALDGVAHAWAPADLVVARLLGRTGPTDWSHALKTGYDLGRREWPADVLEALRIPADLLPDVQPPASCAGHVCAAAAEETGLPEGCEVRLGMTDGCAAQLACGAVRPGSFVSVLGTTLVVKGVAEVPVRDPHGSVYNHLHPDGRWWLPGGASNIGGRALRRFPERSLADLDGAAGAHGPARCVAYPLQGVGERFPFVEPAAEAFVLGEPADEIEAYRAALEGVAFVERLAYDHLEALGAAPDGAVAVAGGGSRSRVWNRIRATVLGRPLIVPATPTSAFGAAVLAAAGTVHDGLEAAAAAMVSLTDSFEPDPVEASALAASYACLIDELRARGWVGSGGAGASLD